MGVPAPVAGTISRRSLQSLRGYFLGVAIVAAFNAVVIGGGALVLGVPLAATIAIITFFAAFVPYLGAWTAGAFAVLVALGGAGTDAAIAMAVLTLLANGVLQQLVQPFAYGAALGIHPLAVLIVTIGAGALFGMVGLVLAAPVTSAVVRISTTSRPQRGSTDGGDARRRPCSRLSSRRRVLEIAEHPAAKRRSGRLRAAARRVMRSEAGRTLRASSSAGSPDAPSRLGVGYSITVSTARAAWATRKPTARQATPITNSTPPANVTRAG